MAGSLTPTELHVLLALAAEPAHGYALVRRIEEDSGGRMRLLPGNLYGVIHRLVAQGLVRESKRSPRRDEDQRRRCYELTARGRRALRGEARHLDHLLDRLRSRLTEPL